MCFTGATLNEKPCYQVTMDCPVGDTDEPGGGGRLRAGGPGRRGGYKVNRQLMSPDGSSESIAQAGVNR